MLDFSTQIAQLAEELERSPASIRAKLTRERVYVAKGPKASKGPVVRKAALVSFIAGQLNVPEDTIGSLEKATKGTLILIANAVK